jgi:hypothetical protein
MSIYIGISQAARLAAVWSRNRLVTQLLLSASIVAYSLLLVERNKKINKYYERDNPNGKPENSGQENKEVPRI